MRLNQSLHWDWIFFFALAMTAVLRGFAPAYAMMNDGGAGSVLEAERQSDRAPCLSSILSRVEAASVHFTYVGVGSCPHVKTLEELSDSSDQLMPVFVRDRLHTSVRVIHFDPAFGVKSEALDPMEFVKSYYAQKYPGLTYHVPTPEQPFHLWAGLGLEVLLIPQALLYQGDVGPGESDHEGFLAQLSEVVLRSEGQLIVQDYSGRALLGPLDRVFAGSSHPEIFKRKILFDMTYGQASCSTDLRVHRPLSDASGDWINLAILSADEMERAIRTHPAVGELAKAHFVEKFRSVLDHHHPNYRQRRNGGLCRLPGALYGADAPPEVIMDVLQAELGAVVEVLQHLPGVDGEKLRRFHALMAEGRKEETNMYTWNTQVSWLF